MSIFTTGAHIEPYQRKDGKWVFVVTGFEGDTFEDGDYIDPDVVSDTEDGLYTKPDWDLEEE